LVTVVARLTGVSSDEKPEPPNGSRERWNVERRLLAIARLHASLEQRRMAAWSSRALVDAGSTSTRDATSTSSILDEGLLVCDERSDMQIEIDCHRRRAERDGV
jgi:hypothetical protein